MNERQVPSWIDTKQDIKTWMHLLDKIPRQDIEKFLVLRMERSPHCMSLAYAAFSELSSASAETRVAYLKEYAINEAMQKVPKEGYIEDLAEILEHNLTGSELDKYHELAGKFIYGLAEEGFGTDDYFDLYMLADRYLNGK